MSTAKSPGKEQSDLSRKTVHQTQEPVEYLYLSLVPCQPLPGSPDLLQGRSLEEGHWCQLLAEKKQGMIDERLFGGRFEHSQPQASHFQALFVTFAFRCPNAVQSAQTCSASSSLQKKPSAALTAKAQTDISLSRLSPASPMNGDMHPAPAQN